MLLLCQLVLKILLLVQIWTDIKGASSSAQPKLVSDEEIACYNKLWQSDNLPFQSGSEQHIPLAIWRSITVNLTLILMQTILQLPAVFLFVFYLITRYAGSIDYTADARKAWANLAGEGFQV